MGYVRINLYRLKFAHKITIKNSHVFFKSTTNYWWMIYWPIQANAFAERKWMGCTSELLMHLEFSRVWKTNKRLKIRTELNDVNFIIKRWNWIIRFESEKLLYAMLWGMQQIKMPLFVIWWWWWWWDAMQCNFSWIGTIDIYCEMLFCSIKTSSVMDEACKIIIVIISKLTNKICISSKSNIINSKSKTNLYVECENIVGVTIVMLWILRI